MDEDLALYLEQRAILLASDEGDLVSLKRHDRKLLAAMDQCVFISPLTQRQGTDVDQALVEALRTDFDHAVVILEARARLWSGELNRIQALLVPNTDTHRAAWWLAAHYPALEFPQAFPEDWQSQVWAALAILRRGRGDLLPEPWLSWAKVCEGKKGFEGKEDVLAVARLLWQASAEEEWEQWLAPLLATSGQDSSARLINWLAGQAEDKTVVRAMGLSCQSRFMPWLASMRHDPKLTDAVLHEIRWLSGDQQQRHEGLQCWGEPLTPEIWRTLFTKVPLSLRGRLWHWCRASTEGAATSLQGGIWCAGS